MSFFCFFSSGYFRNVVKADSATGEKVKSLTKLLVKAALVVTWSSQKTTAFSKNISLHDLRGQQFANLHGWTSLITSQLQLKTKKLKRTCLRLLKINLATRLRRMGRLMGGILVWPVSRKSIVRFTKTLLLLYLWDNFKKLDVISN